MMEYLADKLERLAQSSPVFTEFRFHERISQTIQVQNSLVKQVRASRTSGVGIRVLVEGTWGFSSTSSTDISHIEQALKRAIECADKAGHLKKAKLETLPSVVLARGRFELDGYKSLEQMSLEEKMAAVIKAEALTRSRSASIQSAVSAYNEIFENKIVVTSDGAKAISRLARNEFRLSAVASKEGEMSEWNDSVGRTGPWGCLFSSRSMETISEEAARAAVDLLRAPRIPGGMATVILSPAMVGLLSHEAIGHTVEADFVLAGSVAAGKIGQRVGSPLVSLTDSGVVENHTYGGGDLLVDDEGVATRPACIIREGILNSYLHSRESAALFGVQPTGSARAWLFSDEPLIRMRNTYIQKGETPLEEIIASTRDGYLVDGPLGGQADSTGEFTFGAQKITRIENGKLTKLHRGGTISGQAFDVLSTVDAVSREFELKLGAGYCGKGQPAKVDAGGPYLRCRAMLGGLQ